MDKIRKKLAEMARMIEEKGFVNAWEGNISIADRENNRLYITPSATRKLTLTEEDIAVLDFETEEQLSGKPASSEYRLHKAALLARKDCNAVIHSHTPYLTAFAFLDRTLKIDCSVSFLDIREVPCLPFGMPGTTAIADGIGELLDGHDLITLANHGVLAVDPDIENCFACLECIENVVKGWTIARSFGETAKIPGYEAILAELGAEEERRQL